MNNVKLDQSLWLYAIHSKNADLIHILEREIIINDDSLYKEIFIESIKCHHNDIAHYVQDNLLTVLDNGSLLESYRYYNYEFLPQDFDLIKKDEPSFSLSMQMIAIPSSMNLIEDYMFNKCRILKEISIPSSVKLIGFNI